MEILPGQDQDIMILAWEVGELVGSYKENTVYLRERTQLSLEMVVLPEQMEETALLPVIYSIYVQLAVAAVVENASVIIVIHMENQEVAAGVVDDHNVVKVVGVLGLARQGKDIMVAQQVDILQVVDIISITVVVAEEQERLPRVLMVELE